jgi:excisionase family DNA binding protein
MSANHEPLSPTPAVTCDGSTPLLLTVEQAARLLNLGRTCTYREVMCGALPSIRLGHARRIPLSSLHAYIERKLAEAKDGGTE